MIMPIIAYKKIEDSEIDAYYPINVDDFLQGKITLDKRHKINNIYSYVDRQLANAEIILTGDDNLLSENDFNLSENKIGKYNGFLKIAIICCMDNSCFKNLYLLRKNPLGMLIHERVQGRFMIKKVENGYDVML